MAPNSIGVDAYDHNMVGNVGTDASLWDTRASDDRSFSIVKLSLCLICQSGELLNCLS